MSAYAPIAEGRHYDVDTDTGCWVWKLSITRDGYGRSANGGLAHRRSYAENVAPLAKGDPLDHLCRNRACVNPAHLEPVTHEENKRRGLIARGFTAERGVCGHGHDMTDAYVEPDTGYRKCRDCRRIWSLDWYYRNRDASTTEVAA